MIFKVSIQNKKNKNLCSFRLLPLEVDTDSDNQLTQKNWRHDGQCQCVCVCEWLLIISFMIANLCLFNNKPYTRYKDNSL